MKFSTFFFQLAVFMLFLICALSLATGPVNADIFGKIVSPTGSFGTDPASDVGNLIGVAIRTVFIVAGLTSLFFMLWGAIGWITSGGEQEKLQKAQQRIRNAVIGIIMVVLMFGLFMVIFGIVLGNKIIDTRNGFRFKIPSVNDAPVPPGWVVDTSPFCVPRAGVICRR